MSTPAQDAQIAAEIAWVESASIERHGDEIIVDGVVRLWADYPLIISDDGEPVPFHFWLALGRRLDEMGQPLVPPECRECGQVMPAA